jgi:hypothetical protein
MKRFHKVLFASAVFGGLALSSGMAQVPAYINPLAPLPGSPAGTPNGLAFLVGFDFDNNLGSSIAGGIQRARYSDVFGNNSSNTALTAPGGIYFNGTKGADSWGTVAKTATGDINRDILTRSGSGSTFDLGGQTGGEGAANFNAAGVGSTFSKFAIELHTFDGVNTFKDLKLSMFGRDVGNTAGGATINWFYSIDGGTTQVATGLSMSFVGNAFQEQVVDFFGVSPALMAINTALTGKADISLIGQVVESETGVILSLDNIGAYGVAVIPEPSTYAAILAAMTAGVVALRRRKQALVA